MQVTLRCTAKVLKLLGLQQAEVVDAPPSGDDWYVNLVWIERRKCLLLTHAETLFPVFVADVRKADLVPIRPFVAHVAGEHLASEQFAGHALGRLDARELTVAKTASRSVLGTMNDAARLARATGSTRWVAATMRTPMSSTGSSAARRTTWATSWSRRSSWWHVACEGLNRRATRPTLRPARRRAG